MTTGRYDIRIEELGAAIPQDENRIAAERAVAEASHLYMEGTVDLRRRAIGKLEEALLIRQFMDDRRGQAETLNLIGAFHQELGELQKALDYYLQASPLERAVGDRRQEAYSLHGIGDVYYGWGEPLKALECFEQEHFLSRVIGDRCWEADALQGIGMAHRELGENQRALEFYSRSLTLWRAVGHSRGEAGALAGIARVERDRGNLPEARAHIGAALTIIESPRAEVASRDLRASFLSSTRSYYELYVDVLMRQHQIEPSIGHDMAAPGQYIFTAMNGCETEPMSLCLPARFGFLNGTSYSAPIVSAVCAGRMLMHPEETASQVRTKLLASVDEDGFYRGKIVSGGRVNFDKLLKTQ